MIDMAHEGAARQPDLTGLASFAIASLQTAIDALSSCPEPEIRAFTITPQALTLDGAKGFIATDLAELSSSKPTLYRISLVGDMDPQTILKAFDLGREQAPDRSYARRHGPRSNVLYVGRSSTFKKRIKEHLGFGARQTYALNLASWARPLNAPLLLECAAYDPSVSASTLSHLEDALWIKSMPIFGRQGSL